MTDPILPPSRPAPRDDRLMDAARALEAQFLSQMLDAAGLDRAPGAFGGGAGEAQFASFLREEEARAMVRAGGIGLADMLHDAMIKENRHE